MISARVISPPFVSMEHCALPSATTQHAILVPEFFMKDGSAAMRLPVLLACAVLGACRHAPLEKSVIEDAAKALGGKERIEAIKSFTIEGSATDTNLGQ